MALRTTCLSAFAAAMLMATAPTGAKASIEVGGLTCRSAGAVGYVVGAVLNFNCVFVPSAGGPGHRYVGVIRRIGVDLGYSQSVSMGWVVFAPTGVIHPGDLAGSYGGVQGNASVGVGVGDQKPRLVRGFCVQKVRQVPSATSPGPPVEKIRPGFSCGKCNKICARRNVTPPSKYALANAPIPLKR